MLNLTRGLLGIPQRFGLTSSRSSVEMLLRKLGAGHSFPDLLEAYPQLHETDLRAALEFAADYLEHETVLAAG
jgi:uncharacterized protein (DUF433 family)